MSRCTPCPLLVACMPSSECPLCYSRACMWLCCLLLCTADVLSFACPEDTAVYMAAPAPAPPAPAVTGVPPWPFIQYVPAELPERARNTPGDTGVILSVPLFATKLPWLVRESAPITTPPSNRAATSVVAPTSPRPPAVTSRASAAAAKADSIPLDSEEMGKGMSIVLPGLFFRVSPHCLLVPLSLVPAAGRAHSTCTTHTAPTLTCSGGGHAAGTDPPAE